MTTALSAGVQFAVRGEEEERAEREEAEWDEQHQVRRGGEGSCSPDRAQDDGKLRDEPPDGVTDPLHVVRQQLAVEGEADIADRGNTSQVQHYSNSEVGKVGSVLVLKSGQS